MADQVLQEIKDRIDIVEFISSYIAVKKSGTSVKAVCPFHNEKSPSLMISPAKQIWHCFGCGEGGDAFGFLMKYENISFVEALKILADKTGVKLPVYSGTNVPDKQEKELLIRINSFAAKYYHQTLLHAKTASQARDYLTKRGLLETTIAQWQIGFAPEEFHALEEALRQKQVLLTDLVKAGVSVKNERGQVYDRFRGRITFPIHNYYGEVVGFSARVLSGSDQAKYINSPETLAYHKGNILFGLFFAKQEIRKNDHVVIVEGQMDVISAHQAGFANTVATSGTALTLDQLHLLGKITKNLVFCFDADSAGSQAARRGGELALSAGFGVRMVTLPTGKDPDELIRKDPAGWRQALASASWFIDYYIEQAKLKFTNNSIEQKTYISESILPLLQQIVDPLSRDHYIHEIASSFDIGEAVLRDVARSTQNEPNKTIASLSLKPPTDGLLALEKQVLGGIIFDKNFADLAMKELTVDDFETDARFLAKFVLAGQQVGDEYEVVAKEAEFMVESQLEALDDNRVALFRVLEKSLYLLKLHTIKRSLERLTIEIKQAEVSTDAIQLKSLQGQFASLSEQRLEYEKKLS